MATLSERGVAFHQRDCLDLHERHSILAQQMLQVHWDPSAAWRHPLVFEIQIFERGIRDLLHALAGISEPIRIRRIDGSLDKHNQQFVSLSVVFHDFSEAREFFSRMPENKAIVEDFGREGGPRTLQPG